MIFEALWDMAQKDELILVDGGLLGYHLCKDNQITIREIIVLPGVQREGIGKAMLYELITNNPQSTSIFAKCPQDLESNSWYIRMGFELESVEEAKSGRKINCWRLKKMSEIKLPFSTMKKLLLIDSELRSDREAVLKFEKIAMEIVSAKAKEIQARCIENKRKTIREGDC